MGLLTADDQLLTGWEMLSLHGSVLRPSRPGSTARSSTISRTSTSPRPKFWIWSPIRTSTIWSQAAMTRPCTPGAGRADVLLDFAQRYGAQYSLTECLRCRAGPCCLPTPIEHNRRRTPKTLHLTRLRRSHRDPGFRTPRDGRGHRRRHPTTAPAPCPTATWPCCARLRPDAPCRAGLHRRGHPYVVAGAERSISGPSADSSTTAAWPI